jgi:hypothetical protein
MTKLFLEDSGIQFCVGDDLGNTLFLSMNRRWGRVNNYIK